VILIDTNLLLYGGVRSSPQHDRARQWLEEQFAAASKVGLPWHSLLGFVRLASSRTVYRRGPSVGEAWQVVREWLKLDNVWIPQPTERHGEVLDEIFSTARMSSRFVMDAHLAALAIEHGLTLCSNDRDFARVPKLRWVNPLEAA
jgi:toxin-antitoxin system PIN domain toxin